MSSLHYVEFIRDCTSINPRLRSWTSSLKPLIKDLRNTRAAPKAMTFNDAVRLCGEDSRVLKYHPAIRRVTTVWNTLQQYPLYLRPSTMPVVHAYKKARFFRGMRNLDAVLEEGLLCIRSNTPLGSSNPGMRDTGDEPNPIYLATSLSVGQDYAGSVLQPMRVFLPFNRAGTIKTNGSRKFNRDPGIWRDRDNPSAVYTMDDIPSSQILGGHESLTNQVINNRGNRSTQIISCIRSYNNQLSNDDAILMDLRIAIDLNEIGDTSGSEPDECTLGLYQR